MPPNQGGASDLPHRLHQGGRGRVDRPRQGAQDYLRKIHEDSVACHTYILSVINEQFTSQKTNQSTK